MQKQKFKTEESTRYESPAIDVMEVEVEKGFATSGDNEDYGNTNGNW